MTRRATQQHTVLTRQDLANHHANAPKSRHNHPFAPDRVPPGFHTVVDPDKNPPQPWRDLPPASGLPPYRMNLDTILDSTTVQGIVDSQKLVFHSVGDTGGVNTPTYVEQV